MSFKKYVLQDLIEEISMGPFGSNIKVDNFVDHGIPVLNGSNLSGTRISEEKFNYLTEPKADSLKKANATRGDIVITHRGTLGQVSYIPETSKFKRYIVSQSQLRIRCNKKFVSPIYLTYYFHSPYGKWQLLSNTSQVGVPALAQPTSTLKKLVLSLPSINEQQAVVKILSSLDDKIELNNRMNKTLEEIAQTLFKRWFVDFEFPDENGNPYKSSGGKMVESELGMIPAGWAIEPLYNFAEYINGTSFRKSELNPDGIPIIKIAEIKNGVSESTERFVGVRDKKLYLKKGDILFPWSGNPDTSIGVFLWTYKANAVLNQHIFRIVAPVETKEFVYFMLKYFVPQFAEIARNKQTTGLGHVTVADLKRLLFIKPNKSVMFHFQSIICDVFNRILISLFETVDLAQLRDILLPKLMSGEIRVPTTED